jgi:hypothetical protein
LRSAVKELASIPGILGIFSGIRRKDGVFLPEPAVVIHVKRKRERSELAQKNQIPPTLGGVRTDVVAVGRPKLHAEVDSSDRFVENYDTFTRQSAVSALAQDATGTVVGLGSGHGLLPIVNGGFQSGAWSADADRTVFVQSDPADTAGTLLFGALDPTVDFAVCQFPGLKPPVALLGHNLSPLPIPIRSGDVVPLETVQQQAPSRGRVTGTVTGVSAQQPVVLTSGEGFSVTYADVFTVTGSFGPFSVAGDSGSIVFDDARRALGFVVGGGTDPNNAKLRVSYVLRNFAALKQQMSTFFSLFFGDP